MASKRIAVTGGAGQIAYNLLFRIASGEMLGQEQSIELRILELPQAFAALEGVKMELEDCAYPLLQSVEIGTDPRKIFDGAHYALLVGAKPRGPGMERSDLLAENAKIFIEQGKLLNECADQQVKVFVVGNPCNTNCLIALKHAPRIPKKNFFAMTRLDQNRAAALLAKKAAVPVSEVTHVTIWGNHSTTQVPDFFNAKIRGKGVCEVITDQTWLKSEFIPKVQKRGAEVIAKRGKSSAASAANALVDAVRAVETPTPEGEWFSSGVYSESNPYGIDQDLIYSFPCRSKGNGEWEIVPDLVLDAFIQERMKLSEKELLQEIEMVMS